MPPADESKYDVSIDTPCSKRPWAAASFDGISSVPWPLYLVSKYRQIARDSK